MQSHSRPATFGPCRFIAIGLVAVGAAATLASACRKPSPDERVGPESTDTTGQGTGAVGPGSSVTVGAGGAGPDEPFTKPALLAATADCAIEVYGEFETLASALRDATASHAAGPSAAKLATARQAWLAAMAAWQEAEGFRFGPAAPANSPGGQNFRDEIYSWPYGVRCKIEEQIVAKAYEAPEFGNSLISGRGLGAIEYLLFYEGSDNACSQFSVINANGTWAALGGAGLAQRKADYAAAVAADVLENATALVAAWAPTSGNFRAQLANAGSGSTTFATDQEALNAVSDALFYVEKEVKDYKLGQPLGLTECLKPPCLESPFARISTANIQGNLAGFRRVFQGCGAFGAGVGFDDWLRAAGVGDLADRMLDALGTAQAAADELGPLEDLIASDPQQVSGLYTDTKDLTDLLKAEFVTVLNLELPQTSVGDND